MQDQVERLEFFKAYQSQLDGIVRIMRIVSDTVGGIDDLGFKQGRFISRLLINAKKPG